jgi:hypothetical protein
MFLPTRLDFICGTSGSYFNELRDLSTLQNCPARLKPICSDSARTLHST